MKTNSTLRISEGKTLLYIIPIIACAIVSIISFVFFIPLGLLFLSISIILGLIENGIEFKSDTLEYRKFKSVLGYSWGKWRTLQNIDSFHLRLSVENFSYRRLMPGSATSYYSGTTVSTKSITYDVVSLTKNEKLITLYEFSSYKSALILMRHILDLGTFDVIDHIALKLEENKQKRMNRRR